MHIRDPFSVLTQSTTSFFVEMHTIVFPLERYEQTLAFVLNACVYVYRGMCLHLGAEAREQPGRYFGTLHLPPLRQVFSLAWSSQISLGWLASELQGVSCPCLSSSGIASAQWYAKYLYMGSEDHIQVPRLARQVLYQMSCLPRTHWAAFYVKTKDELTFHKTSLIKAQEKWSKCEQ